MAISGKESEFSVITRELEVSQEDLISLFADQDIIVGDSDQVFTVIIRQTLTSGSNRDQQIGELDPGFKIVLQFKEMTPESEL